MTENKCQWGERQPAAPRGAILELLGRPHSSDMCRDGLFKGLGGSPQLARSNPRFGGDCLLWQKGP